MSLFLEDGRARMEIAIPALLCATAACVYADTKREQRGRQNVRGGGDETFGGPKSPAFGMRVPMQKADRCGSRDVMQINSDADPGVSTLNNSPAYAVNTLDHSPNATTQFPGRDAFLQQVADDRFDVVPQKYVPKWTSRKQYWAPNTEIVNNLPIDVRNPLGMAYDTHTANRDKAMDRSMYMLRPGTSGYDANGQIVLGSTGQFVDPKPTQYDVVLQRPKLKQLYSRYWDMATKRGKNPEVINTRIDARPHSAFPNLTGYGGIDTFGVKDYVKKKATQQERVNSIGTGVNVPPSNLPGMMLTRQKDRTRTGRTLNAQPTGLLFDTTHPFRDRIEKDVSRKRSPAELPARMGNATGMWTEQNAAALFSGAGYGIRHQKKGAEMTNPVPNGAVASNLATGQAPGVNTRQVERSSVNTRFDNPVFPDTFSTVQKDWRRDRHAKKFSSAQSQVPSFGLNAEGPNFSQWMSQGSSSSSSRPKFFYSGMDQVRDTTLGGTLRT